MAKKKRSKRAAAGTKADSARLAAETEVEFSAAPAEKAAAEEDGLPVPAHPEWAPHMNSRRERLTSRIFMTVEVVLVAVPVAIVLMFSTTHGGLTSANLDAAFDADPAFMVTFLAACVQPFVAYLVHLVHKQYARGGAGYTAGNLIALLCAQMLMQSIPGIAGMAVLLWRVWPNVAPHFSDWLHERRAGGVLFDISGALVVLVLAAVCAFAQSRLG